MPSAEYQRLTTDDVDDEKPDFSSASPAALRARLNQDPRFNQPTPSTWKRLVLLLFIVVLFWLALSLRLQKPSQANVVHANRYALTSPSGCQ